jgi:hypothetical protein
MLSRKKVRLTSSFFASAFISTVLTARPANAAVFDTYTTFTKAGMKTLLKGMGVTGLDDMTDSLATFTPTIVIVLLGGFVILQAWKINESRRENHSEEAMNHLLTMLVAVGLVFGADKILSVVVG